MNIAICDDIKNCQEDIKKHIKFYFNDNKIPLNIFTFDTTETLLKSDIIFDIALISRAVYKGITSLLKVTVKYASKKAPQKLITAIETVVRLMETKGFFRIVGSMLIKRALKLPGAIGTFAGDLKDNVLYSGLLSRYRILNKISLVVSMFSSIGGFIATIIDVMDGNWDGYLIFKVSKKKVILL